MNGEPNPLKFLAQWWFEVVVYPIQFLIERFADFVNESREKLKENCQISPFGTPFGTSGIGISDPDSVLGHKI
jgi:hypothetical protein